MVTTCSLFHKKETIAIISYWNITMHTHWCLPKMPCMSSEPGYVTKYFHIKLENKHIFNPFNTKVITVDSSIHCFGLN